MRSNRRGFTLIEIVLMVAAVAIVALVGWRIWDANYNKPVAQKTNTAASTRQTQAEIKTASDLDKATQTLDDTDIIGSSESELNTETDF